MADKNEKELSLIDPIYNKFVRGVTRAIGSTEFYEFFMDSISGAKNRFQFSNRKLIKTVDVTWVDAIEEALNAMQNIIASPRNVIHEEELIVNVANARKAGAETVRHLAMHSGLVENFDEARGEVRPSRLMQRYREDSIGLYENRLVFTTMEYAHHFVKIRHDALFEAMNDEFGAKLKLESDMRSATEEVHMDMYMHIKEIDSALDTEEKNGDIFGRISRMYRVLSVFMNSPFAQQMAQQPRIKGTVSKTNVLKKNKDYRNILKLWEFLKSYNEVGYTIRIEEQSPEINERFEQDIYRNILFNYLILKGYLQDDEDRQIPTKGKGRKKKLKPKFIHQIVEELTEDYDLPDVEIRKVLIEELTKEQLMQEEAAERLRLVEEQEAKRKEEEERLAAENKLEEARRLANEAAEEERKRLEQEALELKLEQERLERQMEDGRRSKIFLAELDKCREFKEIQLEKRRVYEAERSDRVFEDFEDIVVKLDEDGVRERERLEREAAEAEAKAAEELRKREMALIKPYLNELAYFKEQKEVQKELRIRQIENIKLAEEERARARQERNALKHKRK